MLIWVQNEIQETSLERVCVVCDFFWGGCFVLHDECHQALEQTAQIS